MTRLAEPATQQADQSSQFNQSGQFNQDSQISPDVVMDGIGNEEVVSEIDQDLLIEAELMVEDLIEGEEPLTPLYSRLTAANIEAVMPYLESYEEAPAVSVPPAPGTEFSDFKRCACLGVFPGRACPSCANSHWLRHCPKCHGSGLIFTNSRTNYEPKKERCGFCLARGFMPAFPAQVQAAQVAHEEGQAAADAQQARLRAQQLFADPDSPMPKPVAPKQRRGAKLPKRGAASGR